MCLGRQTRAKYFPNPPAADVPYPILLQEDVRGHPPNYFHSRSTDSTATYLYVGHNRVGAKHEGPVV